MGLSLDRQPRPQAPTDTCGSISHETAQQIKAPGDEAVGQVFINAATGIPTAQMTIITLQYYNMLTNFVLLCGIHCILNLYFFSFTVLFTGTINIITNTKCRPYISPSYISPPPPPCISLSKNVYEQI